jgi:NADH-quinone oxidoreductase subunit I
MNGLGILRGLGITFKQFIDTYLTDLTSRNRYNTPEGIEERRKSEVRGIFTVQYPEEKLPVPEEFRYLPILVYDEGPNGEKIQRCTACGICSKVCPPQCIWVVRKNDPATGKPIPAPAEFYIDIDICMNCGLCAEYCSFNSIKMDHDYEITSYERTGKHIYDIEKLSRPASYYAKIRPINYAREEAEKAEKAEKAKASQKVAQG